MKKYKLFYVGFSMIMNKIEKLIKSLGYDVYLSSNKEICFSSANISLINDEYLSAFIIKINNFPSSFLKFVKFSDLGHS